jgi:hypothetical protein
MLESPLAAGFPAFAKSYPMEVIDLHHTKKGAVSCAFPGLLHRYARFT